MVNTNVPQWFVDAIPKTARNLSSDVLVRSARRKLSVLGPLIATATINGKDPSILDTVPKLVQAFRDSRPAAAPKNAKTSKESQSANAQLQLMPPPPKPRWRASGPR